MLYLSVFLLIFAYILIEYFVARNSNKSKPESVWHTPGSIGKLIKPTKNVDAGAYDYVSKRFLMTKTELSFYRTLMLAIEDEHIVFSKVRIADLVNPSRQLTKSQWYSHFAKISSKHVDFVVCNSRDMSIFCVIELDDSSHGRPKTMERDKFVNSVYYSANIKIVRVKVSKKYSITELRESIYEFDRLANAG